MITAAYDFEYPRNAYGERTYCRHCRKEAEGLNRTGIEHDSECPILLAEQVMQD